MSKYDLDKMRNKLKEREKGKRVDANEFIPPKAKPGAPKLVYRFFVLGPVSAGDPVLNGVASQDMALYYVPNGAHWISNKPHACPRIHDENECEICQLGFDLMSDCPKGEAGKKARSAIAKNLLPQERYAINIYFPNINENPEELRGRVMWYNAPKTVIHIMDECINRDNAGDPQDPKAFGVFFDENAAYLFQLEVGEKSTYNNYETSKFLAIGGPQPIVRAKDSTGKIVAHTKKIQEILNMRHDLFTKFDARDPAKISSLAIQLANKDPLAAGEDNSGFSDTGETVETSQPSKQITNRPPPATGKANSDIVEEVVDLSGEGAPVQTQPQPQKQQQKKTTTKATKPVEVQPVVEETVEPPNNASGDDELDSLLAEIDKA